MRNANVLNARFYAGCRYSNYYSMCCRERERERERGGGRGCFYLPVICFLFTLNLILTIVTLYQDYTDKIRCNVHPTLEDARDALSQLNAEYDEV